MSQPADFLIRDGILLQYRGTSGTVAVPEGVRGIRKRAFLEADGLVEEIVLPEGLEWISGWALSGCPRLRRLVLPASLRVVPPWLCFSSPALIEVVIPEGVVLLSHGAFEDTGLARVTIPDTVRTIGGSCFSGCGKLETVSLGRSVQSLGTQAFASCESLRAIALPASLRYIGDRAFEGCAGLRSVRMEPGLRSVGSSAFADCPQLKEAVFPDTLEDLPSNAFGNFPAIERVTFQGNRVRLFAPDAFRNPRRAEMPLAPVIRAPRLRPEWLPAASRSAALKGWREMMEEGWPLDPEIAEAWETCATGTGSDSSGKPAAAFQIVDGILCGVASPEGRVAVPEGVVGIRAEVFQETEVRVLLLPDSVAWIQAGAFQFCPRLETVRLPAGLTRIPDHLFFGCQNLKYLRIPDGVTHIDQSAFTESGLESLDLPASLEVVESLAFQGCRNLRKVRFREGLREIRPFAFSDCAALTELSLPDSLWSLEEDAFFQCGSLERVSLGAGVRSLEYDTFYRCRSLREVSVSADLFSILNNCFEFCPDSLRLRLESSFLDLETERLPSVIVAPNLDPALVNEDILDAFLLGFASEDGRGFRYRAKYQELLPARMRKLWSSEPMLRYLLRHNLLERGDVSACLESLYAGDRADLVVEVLEYCQERFSGPAASLYLE